MNHALGRWLKAGALIFVAVFVIAACEGAVGLPGEPGAPGAPGAPGEPGAPGAPAPVPTTPAPELVAPVLKTVISDQMLYIADGSKMIDLANHFSHAGAITYAVTDTVKGVVHAVEAEGTLTLTPITPGATKVTVTATADGKSVLDEFFVTVMAGSRPAPTLVAPVNTDIPDQPTLYIDDGPRMIDLANHFSHAGAITYAVTDTVKGVVHAVEAEGTLTLTPITPGATKVTVTATADGKSVPDEFFVTVMAGSSTPPVTVDPAPTNVGTIMAKDVEVGASLAPMDVSGYFSPTGLTYTAESSDKATATIPTGSSSLTIAGVVIGTATVTVTATDSDGRMTTQTIAVTVTAKSADYKPGTVTIEGVGKDKNVEDVRIDVGQTLLSLSEDHVRPDRKGNSPTVWTLTGLKKTSAPVTVRIRHQNGAVDKTISVTVKNTKPERTDTVLSTFLPLREVPAVFTGGILITGGLVDKEGEPLDNADGTGVTVTAKKRQYHLLKYPADIFEDADGTDDIKEYRVKSLDKLVHVVIGRTTEGVVLDVTKKIGRDFTLEVYAVDESDEMSDRATLRVTSIAPRPDLYEVTQNADEFADGEPVDVAWRAGADHTVTFLLAFTEASDNTAGFYFVKTFRDGLAAATDVEVEGIEVATDFSKPADLAELDASTAPDPYYIVEGGGKIEGTPTLSIDTTNEPVVTFQLGGDAPGGTASLTITYHVVVDTDGDTGNSAGREWRTQSKTLRMNIVSSS